MRWGIKLVRNIIFAFKTLTRYLLLQTFKKKVPTPTRMSLMSCISLVMLLTSIFILHYTLCFLFCRVLSCFAFLCRSFFELRDFLAACILLYRYNLLSSIHFWTFYNRNTPGIIMTLLTSMALIPLYYELVVWHSIFYDQLFAIFMVS